MVEIRDRDHGNAAFQANEAEVTLLLIFEKQPIELGPPKRSFRSKSSDSARSCRSSIEFANTLVTDSQSQPTSDSSVGTGRRRPNRRRRRSSRNRRSAFKIYALDKPASQQGSPENNEASDVRHLITFSAKDQRTLNRNAVERCRLQSEFDHLVRKRQVRLCLATQRWFDIIGTGDLSKIEKGGKWDNGVRMEQATQIVFDRISGPLMRYLRLINQHHLHTPSSIRERLTLYLTCNMSATSFLSLYIPNSPPPLIHHPKTRQYFHLSDRSISNLKKGSQADESLKCTTNKKIKFCFLPKETTGANCNQKANSTLVFETWKFRVLQRSIKYQPNATKRYSLNSIIHHGLQFELSRAEVRLLCSVYCVPFLEVSTKSPSHSWWSTPIPHAPSVPASTIETCLTGSEHFGEIRL
ncbi:hypothetical protein CRM22_004550 [Opisthorchis felineus]|uniref:Uncharacterized protein n=1 Tax=Opisthorchis felineus TaxID=147828 RepID=A0A4S2LVM6_OPIFE|nr:hypothetical protein CRM22_004550 [Opisthorchis felineus]